MTAERDEGRCDRCGGANPVWYADNDLALAALREIYDGSWTRLVGTDGGKTLAWEGRLGLIAGCTPVIDSHHSVVGAMGERFVFYRLPPIDADSQARRALGHVGQETRMRVALADAAASVLDRVDPLEEDNEQLREDAAPFTRLEAKLDQLLARPATAIIASSRRIVDGGEGEKHQRRRVKRQHRTAA